MIRKMTVVLICGLAVYGMARGQTMYRLGYETDNTSLSGVPLSTDLEGLDYSDAMGTPVLYQTDGEQKIPLACQIEKGHTARLWFIPNQSPAGKNVALELTFSGSAKQNELLTASVDDTAISLKCGDKNILRYYRAVYPAPAGVDPLFQRSGFIHPLWSPAGNVLTEIQPKDHYHHYGIWNPWTKTHVEGLEVDFWNLAKGEGTVRFAGILSVQSGPIYAGFKVRQEHIACKLPGGEKTAINEVWDIRASVCKIDNQSVWVVDFTSILNNALKTPIELVDYRYGGGIGFRATQDWNKENCLVATSEGKTRKDADGTRARWCDVSGANSKNERSGVIFLSHTSNREHPEPMRVWPVDAAAKGEMFFEFCPIRLNGWTLEPQREYVLRYRMIVYDGKINPETAEILWKNFTQPPRIVLQKTSGK